MGLTDTSKFLSLILRHKPDTIGISFNEDKTLIRANQGHSIPVDVELKKAIPPEFLYHGTGEKYVSSIDKTGLISKSRLYVHLSGDEDTAVKVGSRHGKPVIYKVAAGKGRFCVFLIGKRSLAYKRSAERVFD